MDPKGKSPVPPIGLGIISDGRLAPIQELGAVEGQDQLPQTHDIEDGTRAAPSDKGKASEPNKPARRILRPFSRKARLSAQLQSPPSPPKLSESEKAKAATVRQARAPSILFMPDPPRPAAAVVYGPGKDNHGKAGEERRSRP